ncbi:DoxX family protein [Neolewinella lacunae]|uniref:DoxX family protein n=1 Tax=Neolewinella lacunae TaxID=1517758 RepID=A0A923PLP9_9BACT|nr:DoxX family protein [Neolewinella lacunae]MBC6992812.1 DoxX family protein [Neolewinella lacunae]MDN3636099.1 DoxX family protein [Neolewinella lacunae]
MKDIFDLVGRILLSFIFFFEAYDYFAYERLNKEAMTIYGLTWNQDFFLYGAILLLLFGALTILFGYRMRLGAVLLLIYWIPLTFIVHDFWAEEPSSNAYRLQSIFFMKNIAIMGGLLIAATHISGKYRLRRLFATTNV